MIRPLEWTLRRSHSTSATESHTKNYTTTLAAMFAVQTLPDILEKEREREFGRLE